MEIKKGYKQTEIGVIPKDWEMKKLGEVADVKGGGTPSTFISEYWNGNIDWFTPTEIGSDKYVNHSKRKITEKGLNNSSATILPKGTILLTSRAGIGDLGILIKEACTNQGFQSLIIRNDYEVEFLYYLLTTLNKELNSRASGSTFQEISPNNLKNIKINVPKNLSEQQAIAQVLSDTDLLIRSIETLIAKKKAIKQGAMQELLTGKKRLEGFTGEWEVKKLGDIAFIKTGSKNNQDKVVDSVYPFFVRSQSIERINNYSYDCEAILVPGEGGIGSIFHYINGKFDAHQRVYVINNFSENVFGKYVYLFMKQHFGTHAMKNTVKATVDSLRLPTFQDFEIKLSKDIKEQRAIAQILSDMDAEIAQLGQKLEKYNRLKQGLMQELLTGKTRLVQPENHLEKEAVNSMESSTTYKK